MIWFKFVLLAISLAILQQRYALFFNISQHALIRKKKSSETARAHTQNLEYIQREIKIKIEEIFHHAPIFVMIDCSYPIKLDN